MPSALDFIAEAAIDKARYTGYEKAPHCSRRLYPKILNGAGKNLLNLRLNFVTYVRDITLGIHNRGYSHVIFIPG